MSFFETLGWIIGTAVFVLVAVIPLTAIAIAVHNSNRVKRLEETVDVLTRRVRMMDDPAGLGPETRNSATRSLSHGLSQGREQVNERYPDDPRTQSWQAPIKSNDPQPLGPKLEKDEY